MKRLILFTLCAGAAFAGTASIVASFRSPATFNVRGIDFHGGYIYHSSTRSSSTIYKTTTTGSLVQTIAANPVGGGLDRTDTAFWTSGPPGKAIFKLSTTGSWLSTWVVNTGTRGVAYHSGFLWWTGDTNYIYQMHLSGSIAMSFRVTTVNPRDLYVDDELWIVDSNIGAITHATKEGRLIETYNTPHLEVYGVTREGVYHYYSDMRTGWVYKARLIPHGPPAVAPASLGRVKALFR